MSVRTKLADVADALDAMDEQERERMIDSVALAAAYLVAWPITKRYYAKRGAPKWVAPALGGIAYKLADIGLTLKRAEKQSIRQRNTSVTFS